MIAPIGRGESGKHRVYTDDDLDRLTWVACPNATGMSVSDIRYVANGALGPAGAKQQIRLLTAHQESWCWKLSSSLCGSGTSPLKIDYWHAVEAGDDARVHRLSNEARALADELKKAKKN